MRAIRWYQSRFWVCDSRVTCTRPYANIDETRIRAVYTEPEYRTLKIDRIGQYDARLIKIQDDITLLHVPQNDTVR